MAHRIVHLACLVSLLALASTIQEKSRWSRQLSSYTSDITDWIPLRGPIEKEIPQIKRQAVAEPRILTEPFPGIARPSAFSSDAFSSRNYLNTAANRQLYLQSVPSVPSAPQNYLTDQGFGQGFRFGLTQPNFPLNQGFAAPPFGLDNVPLAAKPSRPITKNHVNFSHSAGLSLSMQRIPFPHQVQTSGLEAPKFVDGYRAENASNDFAFPSKQAQSLQKMKYDSERVKGDAGPQRSKSEREEEVQLLYVPLQQLNKGHLNYRRPMTSPQLINTEPFGQGQRPNSGKPVFFNDYQKPGVGFDSFNGAKFFTDFNAELKDVDQVSKFTTLTSPFTTYTPVTPTPKKLKPHQPPLAIFVLRDANKNSQVKVGDVLSSLKNAETVAVLDAVNPSNAPKVFIGPSNLPPPENFAKFELPYLSNIEHSDTKIKQLPFFVAPLSYSTPNGFAKIPFPSPHVGSVVINSQIKETQMSQSNYNVVTPPTRKAESQKPTFSYFSTAAPQTKPISNFENNYYSFEPQTVSSFKPPSQPETQTIPPIRPPFQHHIQTTPIKTTSQLQVHTGPSVKPPSQPETHTAPPRIGSFFHNPVSQYNSQNLQTYPSQNNFKSSEAIDNFSFPRQPEYTTTLKSTSTTTTTTKPPSTYPSQLLETHNPYSINQAFHFSTPLDYHSYFDDVKQPYVTPGHLRATPPAPARTANLEPKPEQIATEKPMYHQQSPQSYLNNYTPEIHYDSDQNLKYPVYNPNDYVSKTEEASQQSKPSSAETNIPANNYSPNVQDPQTHNKYHTNVHAAVLGFNNYNVNDYNKYETNIDTQVNKYKTEVNSSDINNTNGEAQEDIYKNVYKQTVDTTSSVEPDNHSENIVPTAETTSQKYEDYDNYSNTDIEEVSPPSTTTTTTTTTKRTALRSRGRPRYTTTPRSESYESTTRVVVTRRPLRERRPLPTRPRYEPNKISTEKPVRKTLDSGESTMNDERMTRLRIRGRVQYKTSDSKDYDKRKVPNIKEEDLAYQRDVLHQNYPVTLMERASTTDIEAMTEPTFSQSSAKVLESVTEPVDTENAYTNERLSISEQEDVRDPTPLPTFTARSTLQTETPDVPKLSSTRNEEYIYPGRSSIAPIETSAYQETDNYKDDIYVKHTTPVPRPSKSETYATETTDAEPNAPNYSNYNGYDTVKQEDITTVPETEDTKAASQENHGNHETEVEENVVQTTPSYNRVRVRPGVVKQYHQASSTESSKTKERRRPVQPVTYRPALDKRRTTMRIDEIEADLKTKQVHSHTQQEYKHPVYKHESSTEPTSPSTTESVIKRGQFRRRRPTHTSYTTTSTEAVSTKRIYEAKNRLRGRRPTEKPTEKPDSQTEAPTSTTKTSLHTRYSHRPRLSERFNKKPEPEVEADQDSNYSINRPKYVEPNVEIWSPKISGDSFKPYNPNDILDEFKVATTERRSDRESELDIITARNEYEDILLTVTPASNHRMNKKIPDIPPTLEALVEQSKVIKNDSSDTMSKFETILEEVMKNLEEQDKDEYNSNVMKHKGGEIGEIPPERIISSEDSYATSSTTLMDEIATESTILHDTPAIVEDEHNHSHRRGYWKKVKKLRNKVPVENSESIDFAESQYYPNTVNHLGQPVNAKRVQDKNEKSERPKVTTYKPKFEHKDFFASDSYIDTIPTMDLQKINSTKANDEETLINEESKRTTVYVDKEAQTISPGDLDLGTGSPDPTIDDLYFTTPTEPTVQKAIEKLNSFSIMDYLFGVTSQDDLKHTTVEENKVSSITEAEIQTTEPPKPKIVTTESGFVPDEITASSLNEDATNVPELSDFKKIKSTKDSVTEKPTEVATVVSVRKVESSSVSSFMDPANVLSTSMSTEISHETEICFRGKCVKTKKDIL